MSRNHPNVLILFSDQHRYDAAGCNGAPVCRTDAIDSVAANGMRFSNAFTPIALCTPARASLMTGLFPHNHGQLANIGDFNGAFDRNVLGRPALMQLLSDAGYRTGYSGKFHLPLEGEADWRIDEWNPFRGWLEAVEEAGIDYSLARDDVQRLEWGATAPFCGRTKLPAEQTQEYWCADRTIELIEKFSGGERPFAIMAGFRGPHFPYAVPAPYDTLYDPETVERWPNFDDQFVDKPTIQQKEMLRWNASHLTWREWQAVAAHYWGFCTFIDDQIARALAALRESGEEENTLVIYTTDHGDMTGSHRIFNKGMNMYEETHHIPMVMSLPGVIEPGSVCDEFVSLVDIMPTLVELAGAPTAGDVDGRSLLPLIRGERPDDWRDDIFAEFHGYESALCSIRMVRTRNWKYVYNPCSEDELYDLVSDPAELHNLAGKLGFKNVLRRMKERMMQWLEKTDDRIGSSVPWKGNAYDLVPSRREL